MTNRQRIENLIEQLLSEIREWVKIDEDGTLILEDPIDKIEISAHYGATHAATSLIIFGQRKGNNDLYSLGVKLLNSILERWNESKNLHAFHYDFNNFALCVVYDILKEKDFEISEKIKSTILTTSDSKHNTINWLPMRWFVNHKRFEWTNDLKYKYIIDYCRTTIESATNNDGGIEDILPKGSSFNLQYDIATAGILQYLRVNGEEYNLDKELGFLLNAVLPDGDINYQGRGTNQIFGWGNWIYLLSSAGKETALKQSLDYVCERIPTMLSNHNIMLNEWDGSEKYLWWDYHYCSVYTSHFMFWLILSLEDYGKKPIVPVFVNDFSSGLKIYKSDDYFVSIFEGRKKYLSERGPIIAALWTKRNGMIVKGTFAPWQGMFGNNYSFSEIATRNFIGLLEIKPNKDLLQNKFFRKFLPNLQLNASVIYKPQFAKIDIEIEESAIFFRFRNHRNKSVQINIPSLSSSIENVSVSMNGQLVNLYNVMNIRNQYSIIYIFQSKPIIAKEWLIKILI
jgi:hypothetical protein